MGLMSHSHMYRVRVLFPLNPLHYYIFFHPNLNLQIDNHYTTNPNNRLTRLIRVRTYLQETSPIPHHHLQ